ncbi:tRNA (adenosine(37)-N6)-dimethylallyltransferase MiaA [Salinimicrobium sp. CAU 1759]
MNNKFLIVVVGPTAIGKTSLGVELARSFNTEVISADSRQFFKEMRLGTAVPSKGELEAVKHHFIQHISIEDEYSVGDFERDAIEKLKELYQQKDVVVMVGGSGLYIDAVTKGLDDFPEVDPQIRRDLKRELEESGLEKLQEELQIKDPDYYSEVDLQNPHRVLRALEICRGTGKAYSSFRKESSKNRFFEPVYVGLTAERATVYERINRRVDIMMEQGLLQEAEALFSRKHLNALNTVGYKELFKYLQGEWDLETAVSEIKKNTRRFAKRQFTWFRKNEQINWFKIDTPPTEVVSFVQKKITR